MCLCVENCYCSVESHVSTIVKDQALLILFKLDEMSHNLPTNEGRQHVHITHIITYLKTHTIVHVMMHVETYYYVIICVINIMNNDAC